MVRDNFNFVAAVREEQKRRWVRERFLHWCEYLLSFRTDLVTGKPQELAPHHRLFIDVAEAILRRDTVRVIVSSPQGSAKTSYFSHFLPPYWMSKNPQGLILSIGHVESFVVNKIASVVRELVREHKMLLELDIDRESSAKNDWSTLDLDGRKTGGNYKAVAIGQAIFGLRSDFCCIEDPVPDYLSAQSKAEQDKVWQWFEASLTPRLKKDAPLVLVATRMNQYDLIGRVQERDAKLGIKWDEIKIPMCAEADGKDPLGRMPGERLWPSYYSDQMEVIARSNPYIWSTCWQQNPTVAGGSFFRQEWMMPVQKTPRLQDMYLYAASDFATSAKTSSDWTVSIVAGLERTTKRLYILDVWRAKTTTNEWIEAMLDLYQKYQGPEGSGVFIRKWVVEKGQILNSIGGFLTERMRQRNVYIPLHPIASTFDKETRAQAIRGHIAVGWDQTHEVMAPDTVGGMRYPSHATWANDLVTEMLAFPLGRNDDQVDCLGQIGQIIGRDAPISRPPVPPPPAKMFSTDPKYMNVTLEELFQSCENGGKYSNQRIR